MIPSYLPQAQRPVTHYVRYLEPPERGLADLQEDLPCTSAAEARIVASRMQKQGKCSVRVLTKAAKEATS